MPPRKLRTVSREAMDHHVATCCDAVKELVDARADAARWRGEALALRESIKHAKQEVLTEFSRAERAERATSAPEDERERLLVALHDAIRRPMGVVPDSAAEFYDPERAVTASAESIPRGMFSGSSTNVRSREGTTTDPELGATSGRDLLRPTDDVISAFQARVEKQAGCWLWTGYRLPAGYGTLPYGGRPVYAHRMAFAIEHGRVPAGAVVQHLCDNPSCVNPAHLAIGTQQENASDASARGRLAAFRSGEAHPGAKLSDAQAAEIRRRYADGDVTQGKLAAEFGVSQSAIAKIVGDYGRYPADQQLAEDRADYDQAGGL